ncbi:peptidylprolyl isomerase [Limosilactobacillus caecicola]|uniref:peptidylprolyl isomerase n=1 Tax=Limosilactobacillus caecicola TaxID=2941332 RepID=UPI00203AEEE0|nr:peptidylprolyl isomerase [Limosilactobacillus caecicola]
MGEFPQLNLSNANGSRATLHTNHGDIQIQLFDDLAPKTVKNFIELAKKGYYDGVTFHRVIPDFMIQGGDPTGTGAGGESIYGDAFEDEFSDQLFNFNGALSMANAGPNTNGSQFFIVTNENLTTNLTDQMKAAGYPQEVINHYAENGGTPWLDHHHTVFGQVIAGQKVAKEISRVARALNDRPKKDVVIESISID